MYTVSITADVTDKLLEYLAVPAERMAFLLSKPKSGGSNATAWEVKEAMYLSDGADYTYQGADGMELADGIRQKVLQTATRAGAALIEIHSHGAPRWPAAFSRTDLLGLQLVAPQMLWRLPGLPYTAIVIQEGGADALVWEARHTPPVVPEMIFLGGKPVKPTGLSATLLERGVA
jgi:hypothetical protein